MHGFVGIGLVRESPSDAAEMKLRHMAGHRKLALEGSRFARLQDPNFGNDDAQ